MPDHNLFADDFDHEERDPGKDNRCTPERLLAFIQRIGHTPTLGECKAEYGGILGALLDYHTLKSKGLL